VVDAETRLNLEADEPAVREFLEEHDGRLDRDLDDSAVYWVTVRPRSAPQEEYYARVAWSSYPHSPPSVKFSDRIGGDLSATEAWPLMPGYRVTAFDVCKPFTAEAFGWHPEWRSGPDAWRSSGNPFLWVVSVMQHDFDTAYEGRSA
jgi:hypothetical protein